MLKRRVTRADLLGVMDVCSLLPEYSQRWIRFKLNRIEKEMQREGRGFLYKSCKSNVHYYRAPHDGGLERVFAHEVSESVIKALSKKALDNETGIKTGTVKPGFVSSNVIADSLHIGRYLLQDFVALHLNLSGTQYPRKRRAEIEAEWNTANTPGPTLTVSLRGLALTLGCDRKALMTCLRYHGHYGEAKRTFLLGKADVWVTQEQADFLTHRKTNKAPGKGG